jgi:hypothetical protein
MSGETGIDEQKKQSRYASRHYVALVGIILLVSGAIIWSQYHSRQGRASQVVAARRDLSVGTRITPPDVMLVSISQRPDDALTDTQTAVGCVTKSALALNTVLTTSALISPQALPPDWVLLQVPFSGEPGLQTEERVCLFGAKSESPTGHIISRQAVVLGIQEGGLLVALPQLEAQQAVVYLLHSRRLEILPYANRRSTP